MNIHTMMSFEDHERAALHEFLTHVRTCLEGEDDIDINQELELSESDFWECAGSIKFLQGYILKVKWEAPCPKVGCHWHLYYCKLAENIQFQEIEDVLHK